MEAMVFDRIKNLFSGRTRAEATSSSFAELAGKAYADALYKRCSEAHKDNPEVKKEDLRIATEKAGQVISALGDERARLLAKQLETTGKPGVRAGISIGESAGDFMMIHDLDGARDVPETGARSQGPLQLLEIGESMHSVGIIELARRVPQRVLPSTPLTFDCVSGNVKIILDIEGIPARTV